MVPAVAPIKSVVHACSVPPLAGISPARHNMEFLSASGGRTLKITELQAGDLNRRVWVVLRPRRRGIYIGVAAFPPPTPSFRHAKNRGEFCEG